MKRRNTPPKDFDMPKVHLDSPGTSDHITPKSDDPDVIEWRRANRGLTLLQHQHIGLNIVRQLVNRPYQTRENLTYVQNKLAVALFNTSWYAFDQNDEIMRNRLKLPVLADDTDRENPWRQDRVGLHSQLNDDLITAEKWSIHWQLAHNQGDLQKVERVSKSFAQSIGNSALKLASFNLVDDTTSSAYEVQENARQISKQLLDQSRLSNQETGTYPTLAYIATRPVDEIFANPPSPEVTEALIQSREELD